MEILGYVSFMWVLTNLATFFLERFKLTQYEKYVCLYCWSFWLILLYTFNPFTAAITSLLAYILDKYILKDGVEI